MVLEFFPHVGISWNFKQMTYSLDLGLLPT